MHCSTPTLLLYTAPPPLPTPCTTNCHMTTLLCKVSDTALAHSLIPSNILLFAYSLISSICSHLLAHSCSHNLSCFHSVTHALTPSLTKHISHAYLLIYSFPLTHSHSLIPWTYSCLLTQSTSDPQLPALSFHQSHSHLPTYSVL